MKRTMILAVLVCLLASVAVAATHPLMGVWKFRVKDGSRWHADLVVITGVFPSPSNPLTSMVKGHMKGSPRDLVFGYFYSGYPSLCSLTIKSSEDYIDTWNFSFPPNQTYSKHLGVKIESREGGSTRLRADLHYMIAHKVTGTSAQAAGTFGN